MAEPGEIPKSEFDLLLESELNGKVLFTPSEFLALQPHAPGEDISGWVINKDYIEIPRSNRYKAHPNSKNGPAIFERIDLKGGTYVNVRPSGVVEVNLRKKLFTKPNLVSSWPYTFTGVSSIQNPREIYWFLDPYKEPDESSSYPSYLR